MFIKSKKALKSLFNLCNFKLIRNLSCLTLGGAIIYNYNKFTNIYCD